jgi:hypothetical protein
MIRNLKASYIRMKCNDVKMFKAKHEMKRTSQVKTLNKTFEMHEIEIKPLT